MAVKILNPFPCSSGFTSDKRAQKYISSGMAERVGRNAIRFLGCHQTESAAISHTLGGYDKAAHAGQLTQREAKHLPFAGDISRMGLSA